MKYRVVLDLDTTDEIWALYDLLAVRATTLAQAEAECQCGLGSGRDQSAIQQLRAFLQQTDALKETSR